MISIPAPFVVAILLAVLALANHQRLKESPTGILFAVVLWLFVATEVVIGFRWGLDKVSLMSFAALMTVSGIAILFLAFTSLGREGPVVSWSRDWRHAVPLALVLLGILTFIQVIEIVIIVTKLVYAGLLMRQARNASDSLQFVRLGWFKDMQRVLWGVAFFLLFSALVDIAISIDFALYGGEYSARLVGYANLITLVPMGFACVVAGGNSVAKSQDKSAESVQIAKAHDNEKTPEHIERQAPGNSDSANDTESASLLARLNELLIDEQLYSDTELSLQRLARKAGVPTRSVSRAINSQTGLNMSQWVNNARINAACALLKQSDISIAQAMYDSGFTTKSNFNREFRRVTGSSPSTWKAMQK